MQQVTTDIHRVLYLVFRGTIFVENLPPGTTSNDLLVCFLPNSRPLKKHLSICFENFDLDLSRYLVSSRNSSAR